MVCQLQFVEIEESETSKTSDWYALGNEDTNTRVASLMDQRVKCTDLVSHYFQT